MELTRRKFLSKTAAAVIVAGTMAKGKVFGANNRIRVCTVGFNGQGSSHIKDILSMKDEAEFTALCDVDANVLARGAKTVETAQGKAPKLYKDIREALQDPGIDAITIATPNHWHSLGAIWACQAGKDVYVGKATFTQRV
jgi:predicted dehydrogenase